MTVALPEHGEHRHLADKLHPIEAVLLDRVSVDWKDEFYQDVIDPMTPWYPWDDEAGETLLAQFTEQVRERAIRAALEAAVSSVSDSLGEVPADVLDAVSADGRYAAVQLRTDVALAGQSED